MQETQPYVVPPDAPVDVPIGAMADRLAEAKVQEETPTEEAAS